MRAKHILLITFVLLATSLSAQVEDEFERMRQAMQQEFRAFDQKAKGDYDSFRKDCNQQYADFMRQAWESFLNNKPIADPTDTIPEIPPVVAPIEDQHPPVEDAPIPNPVVVQPPAPAPTPAPQPVEPIPAPQPMPTIQYCSFSLFGTPCKARISNYAKPHLRSTTNNDIAEMWEALANQSDELLHDCLALREHMQLCDWAYVQLTAIVANRIYPSPNESTILQNLLLVGSGFDIRLAIDDNNTLCNLVHVDGGLFDYSYFTIEGKMYYWMVKNPGEKRMQVMGGAFPQSAPMRIGIDRENLFDSQATRVRTLASSGYPALSVMVKTNKNQIDFFDTYPSAFEANNPYTKWRIYAETPLCKITRDCLYPALLQKIAGKSQKEAAEMLLNWVQTSLVYEYDDKVWGGDRAFFGEETLYYPYADCEDRSILYSHLMRDLLGLDVLLIYYPGHLATAVRYTDPAVHGDYILYQGQRYYISDPTYIGAPIGRTMPDMNNADAIAIPIKKINYPD